MVPPPSRRFRRIKGSDARIAGSEKETLRGTPDLEHRAQQGEAEAEPGTTKPNLRQRPSDEKEPEPFLASEPEEAGEEGTHGTVSIGVRQACAMLVEGSGRRTGEYASRTTAASGTSPSSWCLPFHVSVQSQVLGNMPDVTYRCALIA
jgi:hypothetical protein